MSRNRRPREPGERFDRVMSRYAHGGVGGAISNAGRVPAIPRGRTGRTGEGSVIIVRHEWEVLKAPGVGSSGTYRLKYKPIKNWPHVIIGGTPATPGVDYSVSGKTLTINGAANLHSSDRLFVEYDYIFTPEEPEPLIVGQLTHLNYAYQTRFTLPTGVQPGDFMLVYIWHWHTYLVSPGWYTHWSNRADWPSRVIVSKRIDTEVAGDVVLPNQHHQGWRGAAVMQILRGVPDSGAVADVGVDGAAVTAEGGATKVVHMATHYGGGGPIDFSRGLDTVNAYDGTLGAAAAQESVPPGQSVSVDVNVGTRVSVVVRGA